MTPIKALTIGTVAHRAGVGVETIRFYERKGLVRRPRGPGQAFASIPKTRSHASGSSGRRRRSASRSRRLAGCSRCGSRPAPIAQRCARARSRSSQSSKRASRNSSASSARSPSDRRLPRPRRAHDLHHPRGARRGGQRLPAGAAPKRKGTNMKSLELKIQGMHCDGVPARSRRCSPASLASRGNRLLAAGKGQISTTPPRRIPRGSPQRSSAGAIESRRIVGRPS